MAQIEREEIYLEYYPKVEAYVKSRISHPQDAEDVISEVFLKVYAALERYDEKKAELSTWIYTITHHTVVSFYEKKRSQSRVVSMEKLDDLAEIPCIVPKDSDCLLEELADALEALPKRQRDIVILHYYFGLGHKEIAKKTKLSYANVRKQCSLAVGKLRNVLKDRM